MGGNATDICPQPPVPLDQHRVRIARQHRGGRLLGDLQRPTVAGVGGDGDDHVLVGKR